MLTSKEHEEYRIILIIKSVIHSFITHADDSHVRKAFNGICDSLSVCACVCVCVCVCVCPHDKTKTALTKITKVGTGSFHHDVAPISGVVTFCTGRGER